MFSFGPILLKNIRQRAFELFCIEQNQINHSLKNLPAAEKKKAFTKAFKSLSTNDYESLKARAETFEKQELSRAKTNKNRSKTLRNVPKISLYEFFVKEQSSSPSITVLNNPRDRELVLFEIFNNLPAKAKKALEKRAAEYDAYRAARVAYYEAKANQMTVTIEPSKNTATTGKATSKSKRKKSTEKGGERVRVVSPFARFVKEEMPKVQDLPLKERMKEIARRWKGLRESERATPLEAGASTEKPTSSAGEVEAASPDDTVASDTGAAVSARKDDPATSSIAFDDTAEGTAGPSDAAGQAEVGQVGVGQAGAGVPSQPEAPLSPPALVVPATPPESSVPMATPEDGKVDPSKVGSEGGGGSRNDNPSDQDSLRKKILKRKLVKKKKGAPAPPPHKSSL
ncbi:unnamed protein product [Phytomonas sp. EM1]|nr:unnamed protein product [Phytomonas sp. EM1]|eukprot:CCW63289.1 unnamed protein product [Phytomonas sp. isolate EM1]